ncbi:MAG: hypothetical protein ABI645_05790, partial [Pseudomonadota bacterium]
LHPPDAVRIIERVARVVRGWRTSFEQLGVPARLCDQLATSFRRPSDIGMTAGLVKDNRRPKPLRGISS